MWLQWFSWKNRCRLKCTLQFYKPHGSSDTLVTCRKSSFWLLGHGQHALWIWGCSLLDLCWRSVFAHTWKSWCQQWIAVPGLGADFRFTSVSFCAIRIKWMIVSTLFWTCRPAHDLNTSVRFNRLGYWIQYSNVLLERVGIAGFVAIFFQPWRLVSERSGFS